MGRIGSQSRGIGASLWLLMLLTVLVLADSGSIHPSARGIFVYSLVCGTILAPFYFWSGHAACAFVPLSQQIYRYQEQYGRVPDERHPMADEVKRLQRIVALPVMLRLVLMGLTVYLSHRLGWGFEFVGTHFLLAILWAAAAFTARGGFSRKPFHPRRKSLAVGLLFYAVGILLPAPLVLFMVTTLLMSLLVRTIGLGMFQNSSMHSQDAMDRIGMWKYLQSVPSDRPADPEG
ncbi:hypothetical protein [Streptomyces sp. KR55]|uniref:hypothetical protein n=1 Tax=Streptomyces sp. KR55 TaxID=3457425 RepID=UPI003FD6186E